MCIRDRVYILAFLFPVMIFAAGFAMKGVYPFGENSALVVDGVHQYTAFYKELLSQLEKGAGWTYSTHSMGYDFYGLFCYYLSSPFSLLVLLFMKFMYVNDAVTAVILIKVGLCSVSMACLLYTSCSAASLICCHSRQLACGSNRALGGSSYTRLSTAAPLTSPYWPCLRWAGCWMW